MFDILVPWFELFLEGVEYFHDMIGILVVVFQQLIDLNFCLNQEEFEYEVFPIKDYSDTSPSTNLQIAIFNL